MSHRVTLRPSGNSFDVAAGKRILESALNAGLMVPYSCRQGMCNTCRGRVVEGNVDWGNTFSLYLSEEDKSRGYALLCQAKPVSDLVVEVNELDPTVAYQPKTLPARVAKIEWPCPDIAIIHLRLPMNEYTRFLGGQYVDVLLPEGKRRSYSIATKPTAAGTTALELHLRHTPGGLFTDHVFGKMKERDLVKIEAPLGTFYLRDGSDKSIVMVATGTGFAPIKAMCEAAIDKGLTQQRPIHLYWGCRTKRDLYAPDFPEQWARDVANFTYTAVLSEPTPACAWTGRTGLVHRAVMEDYPDLRSFQVYACGAPVMVNAARKDFVAEGRLSPSDFFADSFLTEADRNASAPAMAT